ncbi:MAG: hypothetical protein R3202_12405, partial [Candidatus Competibacterales bacterium]|nr:hypothetical protein [Candidatus Competibacterales bacterium]
CTLFADGPIDDFAEIVGRYTRTLDELGQAAGLRIISPAHREIGSIARRCGVVYKPSGAGGGDCGLGFSNDPQRLARFRHELEAAGWSPVACEIDPAGARLEADPEPQGL